MNRFRAAVAAAMLWMALGGRALFAAESLTLTFRAGDGQPAAGASALGLRPYSAFEDVNVVQSNQPNDLSRFWTRRQPTAGVDRYWKGTSDAFYLIRLPLLFGIKNGQLPPDPALIVKGVLRLTRVPTPGYVPEGWQVPEKKRVAFTLYRLTDPDGFGPWRMPTESECPPKSRIPFVGVCGAFRDGRASFHDPRRSLLIPAGRPWRKDVAAGLDAGVLVEECTLPYNPASLAYEFDVTPSLKAWAAGEINDGWALQVSKDTDVSFRFDLLFHTSLAEKEEDRPALTAVVLPRPTDTRWQAQKHVKHPFYRTREEIARSRQWIEQHDWAKEAFEPILKAADSWASKTDAELEALVPSKTDERHKLGSEIWNQGGLFDAASTAYALTGDKRYARPVALVLVRIAQAWRHWPVVGEDGTAATAGPGPKETGPPYAPASHRGTGKWGEQKLLLFGGIAYDLIYDSGALEAIGQEERFDAKGLVEQELFREGARFLLDHQIGYGNFDGYLISAMALAAVNSGDPELVRRSVEVFDHLLTNSFNRDGVWFEACGYHGQTLNLWRAVEALRGYTDPPGYAPPKGQARFDNLDPYRRWPALRSIYRATLPLVWPDKDCLYVNDTSTDELWGEWALRLAAPRYGDKDLAQVVGNDLFLGPGESKPPLGIVPEVTRSWLLPEARFAALRAGGGQTAAILSFGDFGSSHDHSDGLNLGLFGQGRELACDLGYTHTYLRGSWSAATASHNTVLIDGKLQEHGRGDLAFFCPDDGMSPSVQVVEAVMPRAYPGAKRYGRCVSLIAPTADSAYLVDFFRVEGGRQHDFMFHGPATHKQKPLAVEGIALAPQPGTLAGENVPYAGGRKGTGSEYEVKDWYSYISDVRRGEIADHARCRWEYDDASAGLAAVFLPGPSARLFTGAAPNLRLDDGRKSNYRDRAAIDRNRMPVLCIRRTSPADSTLCSAFVSVLEPYHGRPTIRAVSRLDLGQGIVGVKVECGDATQYVFHGLEGHSVGEAQGIQFSGQFGAVSLRGSEMEMLCLIGAGELRGPGWQLQQPDHLVSQIAEVRGDLTGDKDNALVLGANAPVIPDAFRGQVALLRHRNGTVSAYTVADIVSAGGRTAVKLADPRAFLLSRFIVDRVNEKTLHTPQALRQAGDGWFAGKWLTSGGKTYRITKVRSDGAENLYCRGFLVDVEPEEGALAIQPGDTCLIHAARSGDELILVHRTFLARQADGRYRVRTTAKLTLALPASSEHRNVRVHDGSGAGRVVAGQPTRTAEGRHALAITLDPAALRSGEAMIELVK